MEQELRQAMCQWRISTELGLLNSSHFKLYSHDKETDTNCEGLSVCKKQIVSKYRSKFELLIVENANKEKTEKTREELEMALYIVCYFHSKN